MTTDVQTACMEDVLDFSLEEEIELPAGDIFAGADLNFPRKESHELVLRALSRCGSLPEQLKSFPELSELAPLDDESFLPLIDVAPLPSLELTSPRPIKTKNSDSDSFCSSTSTSPSLSPDLPNGPSPPRLEEPSRLVETAKRLSIAPLWEGAPNHLTPDSSPDCSSSGYSPPNSPKDEQVEGPRRKKAKLPVKTEPPKRRARKPVAANAPPLTSSKPRIAESSSSGSDEDSTLPLRTSQKSSPAEAKQANKDIMAPRADSTISNSSSLTPASDRPRRNTNRPVVYKDAPDVGKEEDDEEEEAEEEEEDIQRTTSNRRAGKRLAPKGGDSRDKRARNKKAAADYRKRRKVYIDGLEASMEKMREKNKLLQDENSRLRERLEEMEQRLKESDGTEKSNKRLTNGKKKYGSPASAAAGGGLLMFALLTCLLMFLPGLLESAGLPAFEIKGAGQQPSFHFDVPARGNMGRALLQYCPLGGTLAPDDSFPTASTSSCLDLNDDALSASSASSASLPLVPALSESALKVAQDASLPLVPALSESALKVAQEAEAEARQEVWMNWFH